MTLLYCEHNIGHSGEVHKWCDGCCAVFDSFILGERQRMLGLIEDMNLMITYRETGIEVGEKIYDAIGGALQPEEAEAVQKEFNEEFDL